MATKAQSTIVDSLGRVLTRTLATQTRSDYRHWLGTVPSDPESAATPCQLQPALTRRR